MRGFLGLILLAALGAACADSSGRVEDAAPRLEALELRVAELEQENVRLLEQGSLKDEVFAEYTRLINQTLADMESLTRREGMLRQLRLDLESAEGDQPQLHTIEDRLNDNMAAIETYIRESKRQRDQLRKMAEEQQRLPQVDIRGLETTIRQLTTLVEEKDRTIQALREDGEALLAQIGELQKENETLVEENSELRQVYYAAGTVQELAERGIVRREGGVLGLGRTTRLDKLHPDAFSLASMGLSELFVGKDLTWYEVLSDHRGRTDLYSFREKNGEVYLQIHNPEAFWHLSRFLVVEVRH